jgi:hypothetical protein
VALAVGLVAEREEVARALDGRAADEVRTLRERRGAADDGFGAGGERDDRRRLERGVADARDGHRAAAEGDDARDAVAEEVRHERGLAIAEPRLAFLREHLADRGSGVGRDERVRVDERETELGGDELPHRALARRHESAEDDAPCRT